jgi:hypothetical protein
VTHDQVLPRHASLLDVALPELLEAAAAVRDGAHGTRTTYSPRSSSPDAYW